jgi:hypothetical protein
MSKKNFRTAPEGKNVCFIHRLIKSFLNRTEVFQYLEQIFSPIFSKLYEYTALPNDRRVAVLENMLSRSLVINKDNEKTIGALVKSAERDIAEKLRAYEVMAFSEAFLIVIFESLMFMPQSVRYLLKTIEISFIEQSKQQSNKEVKTTLVDFIFNYWWYPAMSEPHRNRLLKECKIEIEFINNLHTIMKVLQAVFYQNKLEKPFPPCINEFIESKE